MNQMNDPGSAPRGQSSGQGSQTMEKVQETVHDRAEVARDEMSHVTDTARQEVRSLADEARSQVRGRLDEESAHLGDAMRQFGGDLSQMSEKADDPESPAARATSMVGERVSRMADEYQDKGINGLLDDVKAFARRHPGQFIFGAAAAGFLVGRLVRNVDTSAITPGSDGQRQTSMGGPLPGQPDVIDLTEGERELPGREPLAGSTPTAAGPTGSSIAGIAGEEVGTW